MEDEFNRIMLRSRVEDVLRDALDIPDPEHCPNCAVLQGVVTVGMLALISMDILSDARGDAEDPREALDEQYSELVTRVEWSIGSLMVLQEYLMSGVYKAQMDGGH